MSPILTMIVTGALSVAACSLIIMWARAYAQDVRQASKFVDSFYEQAQRLVKDPTTPEPIVKFIEFLATGAGRPNIARYLALDVILRGRRTSAPRSQIARELEEALAHLNAGQRDAFANMVVQAALSSAASDPLLSRVYSHVLSIFFSKTGQKDGVASVDRANTAAIDVAERERVCA